MKIVNIKEFERILKHSKVDADGRATISDLFVGPGELRTTEYSFNKYRFLGCCFESVRFTESPAIDFTDSVFNDCLFVQCQFDAMAVFKDSELMNTDFLKCTFDFGANFCGIMADNRKILHDCNFCGESLFLADRRWNIEFPFIVPETGAFEAWKACYVCECGEYAKYTYPAIVHLRIPEDAERVSSYGRKCRASKAKVLGIEIVSMEDGHRKFVSVEPDIFGISYFDNKPRYIIGENVTPESEFDSRRSHECASGIHFFTTKDEALKYGDEEFVLRFGWWGRGVARWPVFI